MAHALRGIIFSEWDDWFLKLFKANVKRTNQEDPFHRRMVLAIIIGFAIIRCFIAFSMELGTDEAYYWLYSQDIKWNYYDHPPMIAIWIRLFTVNLLLQDIEGFIRFGSVVGCGIASWAIYKTCDTLHSSKAGLYGVCFYTASAFASITAGIFIMPDTPQMVFYTLALWMIARITKDENSWKTWVAFGVVAGLCIMSKVYGAFLWIGVGLFAILKKRKWFSRPYIYVSFLITVIIASPILIWNFENDFITYKFHSSRADVSRGGLDLITFWREVFNQFLYNNPFNVIAAITALMSFFKTAKVNEGKNDALIIFNFAGLPLAVLLLLVSLFRDTTLPHWSGPAYVALIPLTAIFLAGRDTRQAKRLVILSLSAFAMFLVVWQYLIHYAPERIGARDVDKKSLFSESVTVSKLFSGFENFQFVAETRKSWEPANDTFYQLYQEETSKGLMEKNAPVICYKWWGAQIEYYFCYPNKIAMIGMGKPDELHEYLFTNTKRKDQLNLNTAYCIVPVDDFYDVRLKYSNYYNQIDEPTIISTKRKGKPEVRFYVYRLKGWKNRLPMAER